MEAFFTYLGHHWWLIPMGYLAITWFVAVIARRFAPNQCPQMVRYHEYGRDARLEPMSDDACCRKHSMWTNYHVKWRDPTLAMGMASLWPALVVLVLPTLVFAVFVGSFLAVSDMGRSDAKSIRQRAADARPAVVEREYR